MYNGIGLQTARGSGTNGYVQANLSSVLLSRKRVEYNAEDDLRKMEAEINRKPNEELLQHARKRTIEMKCVEFETLMEEKGFDEDEIEKKVNDYRKLLLSQLESGELNVDDDLDIKNSHARMQYAVKGRNRMRDALGLAKDYVPGSSMEKMNKTDVVDAAMEPAPPVDDKSNMLATLMEMKKKEKEKKKAKKAEKKRKRKESTSSSSSDSSDSDSDDSSSSSSEDEKAKKKKKKEKKEKKGKAKEKEVKKESEEPRERHRKHSPEVKRRREDDSRDRRAAHKESSPSRRERENRDRSPKRRDDKKRSPPRRQERRGRSRSNSPRRRRDSSSPEPASKKIKEEPLSGGESPRSRSRSSDSYSSDDGHNHGKMRSMVTKK